ncbi:MAG: VanZ family protein [Chloroflexota bacterium]
MRKSLRWMPSVLIMGVIFVLSSFPSQELPSFGFWDTLVKKGGHAVGYGILALSYWFALKWERKYLWLAFLLTVLYALSDEYHQSFIPGRNPSLMDVFLFDAGGALITLLGFCQVRKK